MARLKQALTIVSVTLLVAACGSPSTQPSEGRCGPRIGVDEVIILDLENQISTLDEAHEKALAQLGDYSMLGSEPTPVRLRGSKANAIASARRGAAKLGCNVVIVLGQTETDKWVSGSPAHTASRQLNKYLMVQTGRLIE